MRRIVLSLLCKYLAWVVYKSMISFLKSFEYIKVVELACKICQNLHSNGFFHFVYYVTSRTYKEMK